MQTEFVGPKARLLVLNSGGRSSAYMTDNILEKFGHLFDIKILFANTGWEHPKTLDFVDNCDKKWGGKIVWLEAVVNKGRVASTHRVVSYETASRNQEPFLEIVKKYGIPNKGYPHCSREAKENPIESYLREINWEKGTYRVALGMRTDEPARIKRGLNKSNGQYRVYPMVDWFPSDKLDVLDYWEEQDFDLGIPEHLGNCVGCFKKSKNKLLKVMRDEGEAAFDFAALIENFYGYVGKNKINGEYSDEPRTMYRERVRVHDLIKIFSESEFSPKDDDIEDNEGCASSCEAFAN
jgi:3'-phosphoadenosine 5'-phosphosulfate sulfotransferase (PAPS reductase)/FAD synthetase